MSTTIQLFLTLITIELHSLQTAKPAVIVAAKPYLLPVRDLISGLFPGE